MMTMLQKACVHGLGLDTDIELIWQHLTEYENKEYQRMLGDGRIGHLLDTYILLGGSCVIGNNWNSNIAHAYNDMCTTIIHDHITDTKA